MKAYILTTGTVFGLLVAAHVWRIMAERHSLLSDPMFVVITLAAAALSLWAWWLAWRMRKR